MHRFKETYFQLFLFSFVSLLALSLILSQAVQRQVYTQHAQMAIWQPAPGTTFQWQLTGTIDQSVDAQVYDIDLFETDISTIAALKAKGRKVICYYSAGSYENFRPDANTFPQSVKGNSNGWAGEVWLDIRNIAVLGSIMQARLDLAKQKGCDGVEPDNVDGYTNTTGFPLTQNDQLTYNKWTAEQAHMRGLSVGLKNDVEQIDSLVAYYDWALNEQCYQYNECSGYKTFIAHNKAVFITEYKGLLSNFCPDAKANKFSAMKKNLNLDAYREACSTTTNSVSAIPTLVPSVVPSPTTTVVTPTIYCGTNCAPTPTPRGKKKYPKQRMSNN